MERQGVYRWCSAGLDLVFPPVCSVCRRNSLPHGQTRICSSCRKSVQYIQKPYCTICGNEFPVPEGPCRTCGPCLKRPPVYFGARAVVWYGPTVSTLIHSLKYNGDTSVVQIISELVKSFDLSFFDDVDLIIPVPLHIRRLRVRGMNQSLLLAKTLFPGDKSKIAFDLLERIRDTRSQTGLERVERRRNMHRAFRVKKQLVVKGKIVCVVDDVLTTGTTVEECSKILMRAGACQVKVLSFARVKAFGGI